jgi:hypothetical protein
METYEASIKKDDLIKRKEHCSADREKLETVGRLLGHQVRIKRNDEEYGLYTVSEVRQENPDKIVRMGPGGLGRLDMSDGSGAILDPQVPRPTLNDSEAEDKGEFVERLDDNGWHNGLIAIAPTAVKSSQKPTSRPSTSHRSSRPRVSARGGARAGTATARMSTGTSPRPKFTRRAFLFSTRSSLAASDMPSPFMGSKTTSQTISSSAVLRPRP